jgi:hypothetical protein
LPGRQENEKAKLNIMSQLYLAYRRILQSLVEESGSSLAIHEYRIALQTEKILAAEIAKARRALEVRNPVTK